jgi:malonate-semialdehyde dehydrogenase (acetylating) / methylmalonate-semialdehyde dehydrogenase
MAQLAHFVAGRSMPSAGAAVPIFNPATGREVASVPIGLGREVDAAVAAAKNALPMWSGLGLQQRINILFDLRQALAGALNEITHLVLTETGKTLADATAEVARAVEIIGHATATTVLSATPYTRAVATDINVYEVRYPVGIVAAISPFNFPVMIPLLQTMMAIACGNTVVAKPSERNPSGLLRLAQLFSDAGLPEGVFNVVLGDRMAVERIIEHPDVAAITFVGSTAVARKIRTQGVAHNKRVQAFGGGKNHLVIMPDADLDFAANAAVSSAFGAAGQRCMAVSVVVAVGSIADELVQAIKTRAADIRIGNITDPAAQLGPIISEQSRKRITEYVANAAAEGATVVLDGREHRSGTEGWYLGPTLIDHVKPGMALHRDEIFGPVLSIVRVNTYKEAIAVISASEFGNGAAIFTRDGSLATRFTDDAPAGQIGINVPIPSPVYFHGFAGWNNSAFSETKMHGRETINFLTRTKTVTARTLPAAASQAG